MANFSTQEELDRMISDLYRQLEPNSDSQVNFDGMRAGLHKLHIHINRDDWDRVTRGFVKPGRENLDEATFHKIMTYQMKQCLTERINRSLLMG